MQTDDFCILKGYFKKAGYFWRLKASELQLTFCLRMFCSTSWLVTAHTETLAMSQHDNIAPVVQAPDLSGGFLHGKKILTISTVPCPEMCFHLSKLIQEVWTAWGCRRREKKIYWNMNTFIVTHWAQIFCLLSDRKRTPQFWGTNNLNKTDSFTVF